MGQKELLRGKVMEMVSREQMTLKEAGIQLKVSYRQARRILSRYREGSMPPSFTGAGETV